jgi:hypothetical protein
VGSQIAGEAGLAGPDARGPGPAGFAGFTLDSRGRVACWPAAAADLFGLAADVVTRRDMRDVLLGPGRRDLADRALGEVAAGRPWTGTLAMAVAGGGPVTVRCDPLAGPGSGALVTVYHGSPQPGLGWLNQAAARIGSTLDLAETAREVTGVAVPGFADVAAIFAPERLLASGEAAWRQAGQAVAMRRLAAGLAGQSPDISDDLLPPGAVIVIGEDSPSFRAMAGSCPVLFGRLDAETGERLARHPGGRELTAGDASFLAMPLIARGAVVGCATFGRAAGAATTGGLAGSSWPTDIDTCTPAWPTWVRRWSPAIGAASNQQVLAGIGAGVQGRNAGEREPAARALTWLDDHRAVTCHVRGRASAPRAPREEPRARAPASAVANGDYARTAASVQPRPSSSSAVAPGR